MTVTTVNNISPITSIQMRSARGTEAVPAAVQSGDQLMGIYGGGFTGSAYTTYSSYIVGSATENWTATATGTALRFGTNTNGSSTVNERMRIDHNGNVGIGTTSPGAPLHLYSATGNAQMRIESGATSGMADVRFGSTDSGGTFQSGHILFNGQTGTNKSRMAVTESTGATELFTVRMDGNVGIGTTSPQTALDVNGVVRVAKYAAQPFACDAARDAALAITSGYRQCICKSGTGWVFTSDGTTACVW